MSQSVAPSPQSILAMQAQGMSAQQIRGKLDMRQDVFDRFCKAHSLKLRPGYRGVTPLGRGDHDDDLRARFEAGESDDTIGRAYGVADTVVRRRRKIVGLFRSEASKQAAWDKVRVRTPAKPKPAPKPSRIAAKPPETPKKPFVALHPASHLARKEAEKSAGIPDTIKAFIDGTRQEPDFPPAQDGTPFCHWPIGSKQMRNFRYCRAASLTGRSYCAHHHARSVSTAMECV